MNEQIPRYYRFYDTPQQIDKNIYSKASYNRLTTDVDSIISIIDGKIKKMLSQHKTDTLDSNSTKYMVCYIDSLIINLLIRQGLLEQNKDVFLNKMGFLYDLYNKHEVHLDK